ncbi:MAG: TIGR00730 family Rossman fold protein [Candidatus Eremiobacteraeota bacterium]|nr:TIGR00730 family Rossman fold protein [Candidatus Eremiobacteraeota bacterium]
MPRLCVFCGAQGAQNAPYVHVAAEASLAIVKAGYGVVYGGGRVGLMGTVADAALSAGGEVIGVIPRSLAMTEVAHEGVSDLRVVSTMHERKALMAELSDGFIALPGGFGTMDEFHEILTWRQLGIHNKPIGLLNARGYYDSLLDLYDRMESDGFVSARTRGLFISAPSISTLLDAMQLTAGTESP